MATTVQAAERAGSITDEKAMNVETSHLEKSLQAGLTHDEAQFIHDYSQKDHDKVFRTVDWRLMPLLMSLYLIANLDRSVSTPFYSPWKTADIHR